eukprot:13445082-Alexandrium_andersonii.AAC.1
MADRGSLKSRSRMVTSSNSQSSNPQSTQSFAIGAREARRTPEAGRAQAATVEASHGEEE